MEMWVFLTLVLAPYMILLFIRHGEILNDYVARAHLLAGLWYLILTFIVVLLAAAGYRPSNWAMFLLFMFPGATISFLLVHQRLRDPPAPSLPES
jgi:hypothetical protein